MRAINRHMNQSKARKQTKPIRPRVLIKINLKILFHYYKHHPEMLPDLQVWLMCRALDVSNAGVVDLGLVLRRLRTTRAYFRRRFGRSEFIRKLTKDKVYIKSRKKIIDRHKLFHHNGWLRVEINNDKFKSNFRTLKRLKGYIAKCFMEQDLRKARGQRMITNGQIGHRQAAEYFGVTERTIYSNLKIAQVKTFKNLYLFPMIKFKKEKDLGPWLLHNMDRMLGGVTVESSPRSIFLVKRKGDKHFILARKFPNIYKFTGVSLVRESSKRGKFARTPRVKHGVNPHRFTASRKQ